MKKNVLLFSHQMKVGGAPTVLCEMGKILSKKYNVVVLSPSDGAMRTQFEEAGISVLISGEITDALRDMIVQEFDFAVANTTLAYEGRQEMKEYYQFAAKYARIFSAGHVAAENFYHFYRIKTEILEFGLSDCYVAARDNRKRDHINVICPSTVCELKGQDILVQAIKSMDAGLREKCKFVFLGELRNDNAKEYQMIETLAKEYQNVELHPLVEREKLLELYYDMDVVVAPSREDATPATIVEGLMYHKICIGSSGTGVSRYLKDGWDGFVFENANADDLRNKLEYMVRNFADLGELRERGRKVYETIYSYDIFEKNVLEKIGTV